MALLAQAAAAQDQSRRSCCRTSWSARPPYRRRSTRSAIRSPSSPARDRSATQRRTVTDALNAVPGLQRGAERLVRRADLGVHPRHQFQPRQGADRRHRRQRLQQSPNGAFDFAPPAHLRHRADRGAARSAERPLRRRARSAASFRSPPRRAPARPRSPAWLEGGSFGTFNQAVGVSGSQDRFNYAFNVSHFRYDRTSR